MFGGHLHSVYIPFAQITEPCSLFLITCVMRQHGKCQSGHFSPHGFCQLGDDEEAQRRGRHASSFFWMSNLWCGWIKILLLKFEAHLVLNWIWGKKKNRREKNKSKLGISRVLVISCFFSNVHWKHFNCDFEESFFFVFSTSRFCDLFLLFLVYLSSVGMSLEVVFFSSFLEGGIQL